MFACQGGEAVWGNATHAPDDESDEAHSHGELIAFRRMLATSPDLEDVPAFSNGTQRSFEIENPSTSGSIIVPKNMTADEASDWILEHTPATFQVRAR